MPPVKPRLLPLLSPKNELAPPRREEREQAAHDRRVLGELDDLCGVGEIPVENGGCRDEEKKKGKRAQPRQVPQEDGRPVIFIPCCVM